MEWSKNRTLKLIELMQMNPESWYPSSCDTRKDKQKRREELQAIANILKISVADATKKIQHLRTQYNREWARSVQAYIDDPTERYVSNWYAFECLHFLKDSSKPYRVLNGKSHHESNVLDCADFKMSSQFYKVPRSELPDKPEKSIARDEFSVFGEYVANELRSLKGEKNLLIAKKRIQDAIFELKIEMIAEQRPEATPACTVYSSQQQNTTIHSSKVYTAPLLTTTAHIEPLTVSHIPATTEISEIIINNTCDYSNFKVETTQ